MAEGGEGEGGFDGVISGVVGEEVVSRPVRTGLHYKNDQIGVQLVHAPQEEKQPRLRAILIIVVLTLPSN